jgi:hypothetical protein
LQNFQLEPPDGTCPTHYSSPVFPHLVWIDLSDHTSEATKVVDSSGLGPRVDTAQALA